MPVSTISVQDLHQKVQAGESVELIDVRTPLEYRAVHATCARNVPLDGLQPESLSASRRDPKAPLYVICRSGSRSRQACERLAACGVSVVDVVGGTTAWEKAGLPVERTRGVISLDRQIRIVTGTLTVIGAALGYWVHPGWIALAGAVGAGVAFSGITDSCALGMLIARMPWNREDSKAQACTSGKGDQATCCS